MSNGWNRNQAWLGSLTNSFSCIIGCSKICAQCVTKNDIHLRGATAKCSTKNDIHLRGATAKCSPWLKGHSPRLRLERQSNLKQRYPEEMQYDYILPH